MNSVVALYLVLLATFLFCVTVICMFRALLRAHALYNQSDREDRKEARAAWLAYVTKRDEEYIAMVESYLRMDNKSYIPPRVIEPTKHDTPSPRAFAMKPSPPVLSKSPLPAERKGG